jgi:hypothetical protein
MPARCRSLALAVLAGALVLGTSARAAEPLADLLGRLAPAKAPTGSVDVVGWVERNGSQTELVVTFVPKGKVKLVADPGVTVTPLPRDGVAWSVEGPVSRTEPGAGYFAAPPTVRLPFAGGDGGPVEATVEYAYCLVDYQCLFGEAKVRAPTQVPQG